MKEEELPHLNAEEEKEAILEGRKKKYFKLKHADYWAAKESEVTKGPVKQLMK